MAAGESSTQPSGLHLPSGEERQAEGGAQSQETHAAQEGKGSLSLKERRSPLSLLVDLQVILKEREERKQKRLMEERGLLPEDEQESKKEENAGE